MEQYGDMMAAGGIVVYIVIGLFVVLFAWWGYRLFWGKKKAKATLDLPSADDEDYAEIGKGIKGIAEKVLLGKGSIKCLCFRKIKGVNVADFTTIEKPIGDLRQFDPSCPVSGSGYIVKENDLGQIVDYDPRELAFEIKQSPEYAWFAINWDIVKAVFFVPIPWFKSTAVWFAAAMLVIVFVSSLAVLG